MTVTEWYEEALEAACGRLGAHPGDFEFVRVGRAATWRDDGRARLLRIEGGLGKPSEVLGMLGRLEGMAERGVPVLAPLRDRGALAFDAAGHVASLWPLGEPVSQCDFDWAWLGTTLSLLHREPVDDGLSTAPNPLDQVKASLRRCAELSLLPSAVQRDLERRASDLTLPADRRQVLIHGDAHPGNVVLLANDGLRLVDFDSTGLGSPVWDLMGVAVLHRHYGVDRAALESVVGATDVTLSEYSGLAETYLTVREMIDTLSAVLRGLVDPRLGPEGEKRSSDLLDEKRSTWVSVHPGNERLLRDRHLTVEEAIEATTGQFPVDLCSLQRG